MVSLDEDEALHAVEDGRLPWAWDMALNPKVARCRELRILPACVGSFLRGQPCELEWPDVFRLLWPHDEPEIFAGDIYRVLNISSSQLYNLARTKALAPISGWHPGTGGMARFTVRAFQTFLKARRV